MANLPFWMGKGDAEKLDLIFNEWWNAARYFLEISKKKDDATKVSEQLLKLLAWERNVTRVSGENLDLFRKRVDLAWQLAHKAGETIGFEDIFRMLGFGEITTNERTPGQDWDIIDLEVAEKVYAEHSVILNELVNEYGLTCRRYAWRVRQTHELSVHSFIFDTSYERKYIEQILPEWNGEEIDMSKILFVREISGIAVVTSDVKLIIIEPHVSGIIKLRIEGVEDVSGYSREPIIIDNYSNNPVELDICAWSTPDLILKEVDVSMVTTGHLIDGFEIIKNEKFAKEFDEKLKSYVKTTDLNKELEGYATDDDLRTAISEAILDTWSKEY